MARMTKTMERALRIYQDTREFTGVHKRTVDALVRRGVVEIADNGVKPVREQIGVQRPQRLSLTFYDNKRNQPYADIDPQIGDYVFWDAARNGKALGLELAGLFLKPLESKKTAWVLGIPPIIEMGDDYTQEVANEWLREVYPFIQKAYEESVGLGDCFLVVNGDLTVTVVPPHVVEPILDENDYSKRIGWKIGTVYSNPLTIADTMLIENLYTERERVIRKYKRGTLISEQRFPNFIGIVPVIHIANNQSVDEMYGKPEGYATIPLLQSYGEVVDAAIVGNIKQGRPTPTFEKMGSAQAVNEFMERFGRQRTRQLPDGTVETYTEIDFSSDQAIVVGETGEFSYKSPGSFTADTINLLGIMFYLFLQHTEFPEFIWGNAIASSKASAETQLNPFIKWVEKNQNYAQHWVVKLITIAMSIMQASDFRIRRQLGKVMVKWMSLSSPDRALVEQAIQFYYANDMLDRATALELSVLDVNDIGAILAKVDVEKEKRESQFDNIVGATINRLATTPDVAGNDDNVEDKSETVERQTLMRGVA